MSHAKSFLADSAWICENLDHNAIDAMASALATVRDRGGRLFFLGMGGSAGNAGHAVNDFRKLCGFEAYAPTDNVSELTARANDEGLDTIFEGWLHGSRLNEKDGVFVFSVGGGNVAAQVSVGIIKALDLAARVGASVFGVVSRDGGYTAEIGDHVVVVPVPKSEHVTPQAEGFQAVIWHCLVSHPVLQVNATKW